MVALSLPPWGWWPLAWIGLGVLVHALDGLPLRRRVVVGIAYGLGQFVPGLWWMGEFNFIGAFFVMLLETSAMTAAAAATPGRRAVFAAPAALVLAEALRNRVPFGGLPMAGVALGQVGGPLAGAARVGGALLVLGLAAAAGAGAGLVALKRSSGAVLAGIVAATAVIGAVAPDGGHSQRTLDVAIVQGGGRRGFRAVESDPQEVFEAHVAASDGVEVPVDLVLWPEDVIDVDEPIDQTEEAAVVSRVAARLGAPIVAGVVEDAGEEHFRNAAVLWSPAGRIVDRYDKVHRVPYGEYVPGRSLIEHLVDLSVIPRDAIPGKGPGVLDGHLGVVISYEVYFADRARSAANAGARVLLVPTNAASFTTSQVPTTEIAAARLRAIEAGRDLAQAAPTGYGAFIDNHGRVKARTVLGRQEVLRRTMHERTGRTIYARLGDGPVIALAALVLLSAWTSRPRRRTSPSP